MASFAAEPGAGQRSNPLTLSVSVDGVAVGEIVADQHRPDLKAEGIGDGHHGFEFPLPTHVNGPAPITVSVKCAKTGWELTGSPLRVEQTKLIEYFAGDIVDNCNLRCPFCLVDNTNIRRTNKMTEETFRQWIKIMPIVKDGSFFLSCLHEATLHPQLFDFLEMIPEDLRVKVFFTSNLCKPLKDDEILRLEKSGIHHLNVSMDTLQEELFPVLRKGGKLKIFRENLDKLVAAFKETPNAPELRYVTMAYKSNLDEMVGLSRLAFEELNAARHEVR